MTYARGKKAVGLCQRCSFKYAYSTLRRDGDTNLIVCPECYDIEHPAERPIPTKDSTALYRPARDLDATASRTQTLGQLRDELFAGENIFGGGT